MNAAIQALRDGAKELRTWARAEIQARGRSSDLRDGIANADADKLEFAANWLEAKRSKSALP